ncbi:MAG: nitrilase-related carbon-nitrogen hydrolase [Aeromicrobium sp.]
MTSVVGTTGREPRSRSWLWLLVGAALLPFTNLQTLLPVASWLAPVFLLRFSRSHRLRVAVPALIVVMAATVAVAMRNGFFPIAGGADYVIFVIGLGLFGTVPYVVDHLLVPRLGVLPRTLVFPAAVTTVELLGTIGNPFGTAGSTAYSQYASLPLMQVASVTGIWGLTFLVCWLGPVINEIWEHGIDGRDVRRATAVFVVAVLTAMIFGGARLAFAGTATEEVRVAALAPDRELNDRAFAERGVHLAPVLDDLFSRSEIEARAGAKIIAWSEAAALVREQDLRGVMNRATELADTENVYLQLSMVVELPTPASNGDVNENHAMLFGPDGDVLWDYLKSKPTPGDGHSAGPGHIPDVDTPYGRLATVICQDDFFPSLLRQAGRKDVDILLLPSSDWEAITDWHAQQAPFRAVENGTALVRPTRKGISLATDSLGRTVGQKSDYFTGDDHTLVTSVPIRGRETVYSVVGDAFAYACAAGLVVMSGWAVRRRMASQQTPSA